MNRRKFNQYDNLVCLSINERQNLDGSYNSDFLVEMKSQKSIDLMANLIGERMFAHPKFRELIVEGFKIYYIKTLEQADNNKKQELN